MRADFAVVLDANVLAESSLCDLFLRLSEEPRLLLPKWTEAILAETERTLVTRLRWDPALVRVMLAKMQETFPEAMITGYEGYISQCANHEGDRHVLAAAVHGRVETIVTQNTRHFLPEHLAPWPVVASTADDYLQVLLDHDDAVVLKAITDMATDRRKPFPEVLSRLGAPAPRFAASLGRRLRVPVLPFDSERYRGARID